MKKIFFTTPLAFLISMLSFTPNLEAAGCNSHKHKKNVRIECSLSDDNCDKLNSDKNSNEVDV